MSIDLNRKSMLEEIRREALMTASWTGRKEFSKAVMDAMAGVRREDFVSTDQKSRAYYNGPLPIGHGQTISQPYIVALMTDLLDLAADAVVLEIGTGSGYQTAVLSRLAGQVYSMDRIQALSDAARDRLQKSGYTNIEIRHGDGFYGWPEKGPFDAIIVTAAAAFIPEPLIEQLKPGGRMVIPVGMPYMHQELMLVTKDQSGETETTSVLGVAFVPLVSDGAKEETAGQPES